MTVHGCRRDAGVAKELLSLLEVGAALPYSARGRVAEGMGVNLPAEDSPCPLHDDPMPAPSGQRLAGPFTRRRRTGWAPREAFEAGKVGRPCWRRSATPCAHGGRKGLAPKALPGEPCFGDPTVRAVGRGAGGSLGLSFPGVDVLDDGVDGAHARVHELVALDDVGSGLVDADPFQGLIQFTGR